MPQIRPIEDLMNAIELSTHCHACHEPVFFKKDGRIDLVVMSIEVYEKMVGTLEVDEAITEAEAEYANSQELADAQEALSMLREKHFPER